MDGKMNELTKEIARALVKCKNVGMPGGDSIDLGNTEVLASYSIVAESRGILAEDVVRGDGGDIGPPILPSSLRCSGGMYAVQGKTRPRCAKRGS